MQKISLKREPNLKSKFEPFIYQKQAVEFVKDLPYAAIFHEQGLGKTKIAIDIMLYWLKNGIIDTVIYLTKKSLIANWEKELKNHTFMKPRVLSQNLAGNFYVFNSPARLVLTHFEVLVSEKDRLELFCKTRNVAIIIDESAKMKNPESKITQTLFALSDLFQKRIIMTGTPVANRPYDIWAQIYFLDKGKSLGDDFDFFKKSADLKNSYIDNLETRKGFEDSINIIFSKISGFSVRETKGSGIIELPNKEYHVITCDWEFYQKDMYEQIKKELRIVVKKDGKLKEDSSESVLKRLLRLIQVTSNPKLIDSSYYDQPGKFRILENIVQTIINRGEKVIVWTTFIDNVKWLTSEFKHYGAVKIYGGMNIADRNESVERFLADSDAKVLIATPASAKEGLTLTVANHAIFYDRNLSLDDYLQAQDRIHRISQTKTCHIYNLIMKDSIDEWIDALIKSKYLAAQLAQGDITLETYQQNSNYDYGKIVHEILEMGDEANE